MPKDIGFTFGRWGGENPLKDKELFWEPLCLKIWEATQLQCNRIGKSVLVFKKNPLTLDAVLGFRESRPSFTVLHVTYAPEAREASRSLT